MSRATTTTTTEPSTTTTTTPRTTTTTATATTATAPTTATTVPAYGSSCVLGSHPDCIDPEGDGNGVLSERRDLEGDEVGFREFVLRLRRSGQMRNDDVTLTCIRVV